MNTQRRHTQSYAVAVLSTRFLLLVWVLLGGFWAGCGGVEPIRVTIVSPEDGAFLKGFSTIQVKVAPGASLKRVLVAVRSISQTPEIWRILKRDDQPKLLPGPDYTLRVDWDTSVEKDGPYQIEVEALQEDGRTVLKKSSKIWVINRIAQLKIKQCEHQPVVARDVFQVELAWMDALAQLPATTVELFVEGKSVKKLDKPPYSFSLDLSAFADRQEVSLNAVAIRGVYAGATAICKLQIDRTGPLVRFLFPDKPGITVPGKFFASLEIDEEFGIQEVRVLANDVVVGRLKSPPYQIPVDISKLKHGAKVTLRAEATDRAGNKTQNPPRIEVIVDSQAPVVEIKSPKENSQHIGDVTFIARVTDESGVALVDFYVVDENRVRLDNILHLTGKENGGAVFEARVPAVLTRFGAGRRYFEVVARDIRGNVTTRSVALIFGCRLDTDCPAQNPPLKCLGNRCLVPRTLGDLCAFSYSCDPPYVCHFGGFSYCTTQKYGVCRQDCSNGQPCPPGYFCRTQASGPAVCFPSDPCDPVTSNCDAKSQCTPWGVSSFVCLPTGNLGAGARCTPYTCTAGGGCIKDYICVPDNASGLTGVCRRICDLDFPSRDCKAATRCTAFPLRDGSQNSIGFCAP